MTSAARPPRLEPGARVHVVAPSGPVPAERLDRGLRVLRRRFDVDIVQAPNLHEQSGYFAGSDSVRLAALQRALGDPDAQAVFCARGGYGVTRLLSALDPKQLRECPKILIGFSDVTALLSWALTRAHICTIHGPVVTQMSTLADEDIERLADMVRGEEPVALMAEEGTVLHGGRVEGPLVAGNLEVLRSLVGTRYFPKLAGKILAIEEIAERPYRIDRALTQLITSGVLRGIRGVAVGQLIGCEEPEHGHRIGPTAHEVVVERLKTLGVPVVTGFAFGHDATRNAALPFGTHVQLDADNCTLYFLESAVG